MVREITHSRRAMFSEGAWIAQVSAVVLMTFDGEGPAIGSRGEIYRKARRDVDLQQSVFFHSVSERVTADAEHASRVDLVAFSRIQGLFN